MKSDSQIAAQFKKHLKLSKDGLASQYENTRNCESFYTGDYMDFWIGASSTDQFGVKKRAMVQINKVKPFVNAVKGFMAQNRREAKYSARMNGGKIQELYSDYANGLKEYVRRNTYADQKETQQDGDMLKYGYGVIETAMTYTNGQSTTSPNGQIKMGRIDPESYGWDAHAKEPGLMDRRWDFVEEIYSLDDALDLFQDAKEDDFESASDEQLSDGEGGFKFYARGGRYNKIKETSVDWSDEKLEMVKVYFYQWYEYETFYRADNPLLKIQDPRLQAIFLQHLEMIAQEMNEDQNDLFAFDPKASILTFDEEIKGKLEKIFGASIEPHEHRRKAFYSAVISKDHVFTKYRNPGQSGFTRKVKTGDYDAKKKIWVGMVNSMIEPVLYYNKGLTELMFIIGANSKGGVYIEEDAVDDLQKFEQQYAKTDAVIVVAPGTLKEGKIESKKQAQAVTGYEDIVKQMSGDIQDVTGIDRSFLGSSENKQDTGILQRQRIKQVISTLACYFDSITLYQIEHARLLLDFMRIFAENNDGDLFSIHGENGKQQFLQISKDKLVSEYDIEVNEAPQSPEEKQEFVTIIAGIGDKLAPIDPQTAKVIYALAIKYLPLENEDQQTISQLLMPQQGQTSPQQVAQMEQMLKQLTSQVAQAELAEKLSKIRLNDSKAALDQSKIPLASSEIVKNKATAFHQTHEALLDEYVAKHDPHPQATA